jgi:hypothetical protein
MKRIFALIFILITGYFHTLSGQTFLTPDDELVNGYSVKISGTDYEYHSCIPGLRQSIIIRADSGKDSMTWETDPVVLKENRKYAAVIWVAAIGSSPGNAAMSLSASGNHFFTFQADGKPSWTLNATDGTSLSFNSIMTDQFGDKHGYMILRIPASKVKEGRPLRISVTGGRSGLTSWYMTYKKQIRTGVSVNTFPAILKRNNSHLQLVEVDVFFFGKAGAANIYANGRQVANTYLKFGYNTVNIGLPEVSQPSPVEIKVNAGKFTTATSVVLQPVRRWTIDLIQHTHTDIGYTRSQTEILAEHLRYLDYALDYCDATDNLPDNAKFRWTCEASWPVDEFLRTRPAAQIERLMKRIREGRIEVTGMYFNFDEIPDEQILSASLEAAGRIKARGIPVTLAMQNDVNGIGWCLNDYFKTMGIKYLNMGTHGHRALICFDRPTMFWWESPSGNRVLTFRAEHYMTGNTVLEIQSRDLGKFQNNLLSYLKDLASKNYPYDEMAIQLSGYLTDNSPPSTLASEMITRWDEVFEWPKLRTSTAETFFRNMEHQHGNEFPVIRGAWPDWWTDGFGASARETSVTRKGSVSFMAATGALSMASVAGMKIPEGTGERIDLINNALLFYTEHTTGYSESVREPFSLPTMEQRALKESYAWEANRRTAALGEDAMGLLQGMFKKEKDPSLLVFNTLNWKRSGMVVVFIDHQIVPMGSTAGVFGPDGKRYPAQPLTSRSDGTYWAIEADDIPAFGYRKFTIRPLNEQNVTVIKDMKTILENDWYRIICDPAKGTISSLFDKDLSLELKDPGSQYGIGEFILEELGNRSQMESRKLIDYKRLPLDTVWFDSFSKGPVFNSIKFLGETRTAVKPRGFTIEIRLYNNEKKIEIACSIIKKSIVDPESFYIAFPFILNGGKHFTEVQGGVIETGKDQIKGSSNDWYTVQNFTAVRNQNAQLVMSCGEMPLMQFGAINTGRYIAGAMPESTNIFSWPMNNYWVTNFNADQRGGHTWSYFITSSADASIPFASRFGWGSRVPFLTRILPGEGAGDTSHEGSFITGWPENVVLVSARPAGGKNILIHLRETAGKDAVVDLSGGLSGKKLKIIESDITGAATGNGSPRIGPLESKFFLIIND